MAGPILSQDDLKRIAESKSRAEKEYSAQRKVNPGEKIIKASDTMEWQNKGAEVVAIFVDEATGLKMHKIKLPPEEKKKKSEKAAE